MKRKIQVLGVELDNYSVRESMLLVDGYLKNTLLSVITVVSMDMLVMSSEFPESKEMIENCDLSVIGDKEILTAVGIDHGNRYKETKEDEFIHEFLRKIARGKKRVFLLANTQEEIDKIALFIEENYTSLVIAGKYAYDKTEEEEEIVNSINIVEPDVIISLLEYKVQTDFLVNHQNKMSARVWLGLGKDYRLNEETPKVMDWLKNLIRKGIFHREVSKYNVQNDNEHNPEEKK